MNDVVCKGKRYNLHEFDVNDIELVAQYACENAYDDGYDDGYLDGCDDIDAKITNKNYKMTQEQFEFEARHLRYAMEYSSPGVDRIGSVMFKDQWGYFNFRGDSDWNGWGRYDGSTFMP